MERYHVLQMVGQGCFGKVFKGRRKQTGKIVAMKFISKRGKPEKDQENLRREIGILQRLDHENIILLLDWFETSTDFVVVTQFAYGELFEIFQDDKRLPEAEVSNIGRQLVKALNYLHSEKVIHRDMKPQNVLVSSNGTIKLCDFGFARALSSYTTVLTSIKGTPLYMAPELVQELPYDGRVDLWSLGVICYELFVGQPPFYTNSLMTLVQLIIQKPVHFPDSMSSTFRSFLKGLLQKDPSYRLGWPDLLSHPFIKEAFGRQGSAREVGALRPPPARARSSSAKATATKHLIEAWGQAAAAPLGIAGGAGGAGAGAPPGAPVTPGGCQTWQTIEPWLPFFRQASAAPGRHCSDTLNEDFADLCVKVLELYAEVLDLQLVTKETPRLERQGLELSLTEAKRGEGKMSLPLSWLLRGLIHVFSHANPPAVLSRLATTMCASQLLKVMKCLCQSHARDWGPAWDVLSDLSRLFGLWLRSLLTLGMTKLCDEVLCPDGILFQFLALAPALIVKEGSCKELGVQSDTIIHVGAAINSVKCIGVVFSHISNAASASPGSSFAAGLYRGLSGLDGNKASKRTAEAVALLCACLRWHPRLTKNALCPANEGEKMFRAVVQALAALITRSGKSFPWGDLATAPGAKLPSSKDSKDSKVYLSVRGLIDAVRTEMARSEGLPGEGELTALLWELRHDASALKLLIGLLWSSNEMCKELAASLTDSIGLGFSPESVLTAIEATCQDRAQHKTLGPLAMLLVVHVLCLRPFGGEPQFARVGSPPRTCSPLPPWCNLTTMQAVISCLPFDPGQQDVISVLCRCYALELVAALGFCLTASKDARAQICESMNGVRDVVHVLLSSAATKAFTQQLMDELQLNEVAAHGCLLRGPLDGVLAVASLQRALTSGSPPQLVRTVLGAAFAAEEPESLLALMGPKALLQFLDIFAGSQEFLAPSFATLRCALSLFSALQCLSMLPLSEIPGMPINLAPAFEASLGLILQILQLLEPERGQVEEIHAEFHRYQTIATVLRLFATLAMEQGMAGGSKTWWPCFCSGLHLLTVLVLEHQTLAHEFVMNEGVQMVKRRKLLSMELVFSEEGGVVVTDVLVILSQLARLSADYYPLLFSMDICPALRELLSCANPAVRAKACSAVGNMVRHSDVFYHEMKQAGVIKQLVQLCSDSDEACRKFASFAVGNSAFHSYTLYNDLAPAIPKLLHLLRDPEEKTRANAAGALGNLVRNSDELCRAIIQEGALEGLCDIIRVRCPAPDAAAAKLTSDSSVKIALFSLGNLAVHAACRSELCSTKVVELCQFLVRICNREEMVHQYAKRLLQKLGLETARRKS